MLTSGRRCPASTSLTLRTTGQRTFPPCGSRLTAPKFATHFGPIPSMSCTKLSTTPARAATLAACYSPGNGPSPRDEEVGAFCSGGDQRIRGKDGYRYTEDNAETADTIDPGRSGRLHILECQRLIRFMPKVVIARGARLGCWRRPQPACHLRPNDRQRRTRPLANRPTPTWLASTAASGQPC